MEKKRSLKLSQGYSDFGEIDPTKRAQIKKQFPVYYSNDENDMKEEVINISYIYS